MSPQAGMGPLNYDELAGLENVLFEDSFVREIVETKDALKLVLTVALTPQHPAYEPPEAGQKHTYRPATLTFPHKTKTIWHSRSFIPFTDAEGAKDLGNVDQFVATNEAFYHLEGEWGSVDVFSQSPVLIVLTRPSHARTDRAHAFASWASGAPEAEGHDHDHDHRHD